MFLYRKNVRHPIFTSFTAIVAKPSAVARLASFRARMVV